MDLLTPLLIFLVRTLAGYLLGAGQVVAARRTVDWGLRSAPTAAELWALRGHIFLRTAGALGQSRNRDAVALLEEAEAAYARADELHPGQADVSRERGLALLRLAWAIGAGQPDAHRPDLLRAAAAEFTRVLAMQPRRADVLHERAMTHATLRLGATDREAVQWLERAIHDLDRSLTLRPHAPDAVFHRAEVAGELGRTHRRAGRYAAEATYHRRSLEDCERVLRLRPGWEAALLLLSVAATALARLGDDPAHHTDIAIGAAGRVLERDPRNAQAFLVRADARVVAACHLAAGGDARAGMVWRQALTDLESAMDAVGLRGREDVVAIRAGARCEWAAAQRRAGSVDGARDGWLRALEDYERAVDDDPADADRLAGRARALAGLADLAQRSEEAAERRGRALDDLGQALALRPSDPALVGARADLLAAPGTGPGEARAALAELEGVLAASPDHEGARAARRRALLRLVSQSGSGEERARWLRAALAECEWALRQRRNDAAAHYDHARALYLAGRPAEAYAALEQALAGAPGLRHTARHDPVWAPVAEAEGFRRLVGG